MTDPNNAHSAPARTTELLSRRIHRSMVIVVTAWFGITLSGSSLAASGSSHKDHSPTKPQTTSHQPSARPSAPKATADAKPKVALTRHPTQPRQSPAKSRIAAKSTTPTRAHQPPRKAAKSAAKQTKHSA